MSHTLMHVARRSLNQKELVLVAIVHGRRSPCQLVATRLARQYKIFGAMSKDSYGEICKYFGIDKVEESIRHRQEKFV